MSIPRPRHEKSVEEISPHVQVCRVRYQFRGCYSRTVQVQDRWSGGRNGFDVRSTFHLSSIAYSASRLCLAYRNTIPKLLCTPKDRNPLHDSLYTPNSSFVRSLSQKYIKFIYKQKSALRKGAHGCRAGLCRERSVRQKTSAEDPNMFAC